MASDLTLLYDLRRSVQAQHRDDVVAVMFFKRRQPTGNESSIRSYHNCVGMCIHCEHIAKYEKRMGSHLGKCRSVQNHFNLRPLRSVRSAPTLSPRAAEQLPSDPHPIETFTADTPGAGELVQLRLMMPTVGPSAPTYLHPNSPSGQSHVGMSPTDPSIFSSEAQESNPYSMDPFNIRPSGSRKQSVDLVPGFSLHTEDFPPFDFTDDGLLNVTHAHDALEEPDMFAGMTNEELLRVNIDEQNMAKFMDEFSRRRL